MKDNGSRAGWGFWLGWVLASAVGMFVGSIIVLVILFLIYDLLEGLIGGAVADDFFEIEWPGNLIGGIILGIGVGIPQWLVLRRRISGVSWWVLASAAAGIVVIFLFFSFIDILEPLSFGSFLRYTGIAALGGAVIGILQWFVLRGKVSRAGWWVLASTVGWALGMAVSEVIPWGGTDEDSLVPSVMTGVVLGAVTGAALVWLLRQSAPEAQLE